MENEKQVDNQEQNTDQQNASSQGENTSQKQDLSLIQVLDVLKNANLINLDMPLNALIEQLKNTNPDPSTEWGVIGDSGHLVFVWKSKHS